MNSKLTVLFITGFTLVAILSVLSGCAGKSIHDTRRSCYKPIGNAQQVEVQCE